MACNCGNNNCNCLDFRLPSGATGATGATGAAGPTGPAGVVLKYSLPASTTPSTSATTPTVLVTYTPTTTGAVADISAVGDEYIIEAIWQVNSASTTSSIYVYPTLNGTQLGGNAYLAIVPAGSTSAVGVTNLKTVHRVIRVNATTVHVEGLIYAADAFLGVGSPVYAYLGTNMAVGNLDAASSITFVGKSNGTTVLSLRSATVKLIEI